MKLFRLSILALSSISGLAALSSLAYAEPITYFTSTVAPGASSQLGRLSRNNVAQDWLGDEVYPGVINTGTSYSFHTYTFSSSLFAGAPYVDISVFDETATGAFFASAYAGSYNPLNMAQNWLGDAGGSGDYFGTDARAFDVVLPAGANLVLVMNNTLANGVGTTNAFDIGITAFADTQLDDPVSAPTPEPSTIVTLGTGLLGVAAAARRRMMSRA